MFAELHATTIREVVSFHDYPSRFDPDGQPLDPGAAKALAGQLDQLGWLGWWTEALRTQRERVPYTTSA